MSAGGPSRPLAILCGSGALPLEVARAAAANGQPPFLVGVVGSSDPAIEAFPHVWVHMGQIGKMFGDVGGTLSSIVHHYSHFNWVIAGDTVVCEGTSHGEHRDGPWRAGVPEWAAGRWCDVFEIRDWKIQRCFIYLDPDYAAKDTERYPWLPRG